jgi:hypothetical protein
MAHLRRVASIGLWVGLLIWSASPVALAQGTRGTIVGSVADATGAKLPAIPLVLTSKATGSDRPAASGVEGTYTFGGLQPGEYRLRVDDDRFAPWSQDAIMVAAGERKTIDIVLQPRIRAGQPGAIAGTVIGTNGQPIAGATVVLTGPGGEKRATSAGSGAYSFPGLAAGTYRLRVDQAQALPYASGEVPIAAGESRLVEVRLQPLPPPPPPPLTATAPAGAPATGAPPPAAPPRRAPRAPAAGAIPEPPAETVKGLEPMPNRWTFQHPDYRRYNPPEKMPFVQGGGPLDPYNQNQFKGDYPLGNSHTFLNLNLQFNSQFNPRTVGSPIVEGGVQQLAYNQNMVMGAELFGGNTVFQPKIWAARVTTVTNINAVSLDSLSFGDLDRGDTVFAFEEMFGEARLSVLGPEFDFMSVRGGMQNLNIDFRGFVFVDNAFGVRLFGNRKANRQQYNIAYFSLRQRKGALHDIADRTGQDVFIGNWFLGGLGADTYIPMVNVLFSRDPRPSFAFQEDGGFFGEGSQTLTYVGFHGDGHWGGLAVSHAFYQVFGTDNDNFLGEALGRGSALSVNAQMAAIELSRDSDAMRLRGSFFFASGDGGAGDSAGGFGAIVDNPNFAGGQFQFWTQQAINVPGIGQISNAFSLLPDIRNKNNDRANFLNPGLLLFGGGVDLRLSPSLKLVTNASMLRFANVAILNQIRSISIGDEPFTDANIGLDLSAGFKWRPFVNENLFVVGGFALLKPMGGFANAIGRTSPLFTTFATFQIAY